MSKKLVQIFSGGMDSTTLLYHLLSQGWEVHTLSFNYGQRHKKELDAAKEIVKDLLHEGRQVANYEVDLSTIKPLLKSSQTGDISVPHGHYAEENMKQTVVPNRNMIMLSIASGYALSIEAPEVYYGAHGGDHAVYPDCRREFVQALNKTLIEADWKTVQIRAPFLSFTKTEIVKLGHDLGVPFEKTWTCYEGEDLACGRCGTCTERLLSFHEAGLTDPLSYKDSEYWKTVYNIS